MWIKKGYNLTNGGFPDIAFDSIKPAQFFRKYLGLAVFKDLTERFGIRNISVVKLLMNRDYEAKEEIKAT